MLEYTKYDKSKNDVRGGGAVTHHFQTVDSYQPYNNGDGNEFNY
jgi:hypothetical protein